MLLGKIEIVFAEGFGLQAGVDITFKCQNRLAGILRREIWLPVMKASGVDTRQFVADAHQRANLRRRQFPRFMDQLLGVV